MPGIGVDISPYPPGFATYQSGLWVVDWRAVRDAVPGYDGPENGIGSWDWYLKASGAAPLLVRILENDDIPYFVSNSARVTYEITGGVPIAGEYIRSVEIHISDTITDEGWEVSLHSRAERNAADLALLWTSPSQGVYSLSFDYNDLDPGDTHTARSLVLRVKCITEYTDYRFVGLSEDFPHYGAGISSYKVVACGAASLSPEDIVADLVSDFTTAAQRNFPDSSGITVGQMDFSEPTTRYDILEAVNDLVRWQWGFGPGAVFTFKRPWTAANVPDRSCYDIPYSLFAPSVTLPMDDLWNACEVFYMDKKGRQKTLRHSWTNSAIPTGTVRRQAIQAPDHVHNAAQAQTLADAFAADHAGDVPTGTIPLVGMVPLVDGRQRHALHIRPGEYVYLRGAPSQEVRCLRITRVEKTPDTQECVVEVGRNPDRLDRLLARWDMKTKRRRRRK